MTGAASAELSLGRTEPASAPGATRAAALLFAGVMLASAMLVFLVEPMMGKLVLPTLGGSSAVWNTSLAFFQVALLVGYAYAHLLQRIGSIRRQAVIHGLVLVAASAVLPLRVTHLLGPPGTVAPAIWLTGVLALSLGLPFAALSATAPLIQAWYARLRAQDPSVYRFYAASNLGSLVALLAYPVIVEPNLSLHAQALAWSLGYGGFLIPMAAAAAVAWNAGPAPKADADRGAPILWRERLIWMALAAAPASLMLGVTNFITTDIASAPFLWVAPLALYLTSFIIAFQARPLIRPHTALLYQGAAVVICLVTAGLTIRVPLAPLLLHLIGFFLVALVCHQTVAARRPAPARLTEFYLMVSLGGAIGGAFSAFVAPVIFRTVVEYPLVLVLAGLARPWGRGPFTDRERVLAIVGALAAAATLIFGGPQGLSPAVRLALIVTMVAAFLLRDRAWAFVALCAALAVGSQQLNARPGLMESERGFFGVLQLDRIEEPQLGPTRELIHGTTLHGAQAEASALRCRPLTYYAPTTPIGQVFTTLAARKSAMRIAAVGMGAGTVATYARRYDNLRFFEIDPLVVRMATDPSKFSYIHGCARGRVDWVLGDGRLTLAREPAGAYDLILVDAFSSDSVPAHLMTVEAMRGYLAKLKPDGVVIMHLSNRNLELMSPVAAAAHAAGGAALAQTYQPADAGLVSDAAEEAVILARNEAALDPFRADRRWIPARANGVRAWTDDYTNVFGAMIRRLQHPEAGG